MLGGVDGSFHLPLPSMNRLNQTEPATFCNHVVLDFLLGFYFSVFKYNWKKVGCYIVNNYNFLCILSICIVIFIICILKLFPFYKQLYLEFVKWTYRTISYLFFFLWKRNSNMYLKELPVMTWLLNRPINILWYII